MFSDQDLAQIAQRGSNLDQVKEQIKNFKDGFPSIDLKAAPKPGKGILVVNEEDRKHFVTLYDKRVSDLRALKFVPASGAATRMFKDLFSFLSSYEGTEEAYRNFTAQGEKNAAFKFLKNLERFAFYDELKEKYQALHNESLEEAHLKRKYKEIIETLLLDKGLDYGALPKALLKFHQYPSGAGTSLQEHFLEGTQYAKGKGNEVHIHFTVSGPHKEKFQAEVARIKAPLEAKHGITYHVSYSVQKPSTDTIAVDMNNDPFRNEDGTILFRPAGHGALLENLNDLDADVVFVKNIDNVVPDHLQPTTYEYKKVLGGILLSYTEKINQFLAELENLSPEADLEKYEIFLFEELQIEDTQYAALPHQQKIQYLFNKLNRPVRTCGMVMNDGDPGGGPFFALNPDGSTSTQIVETAQIDQSSAEQMAVFKQASYFNPADLACSIKNYKGEPFDLLNYRDMETGFITQKSKDGKDLKAQELPGLWNGSMSDWITLFVEVPLITFNPVKSINDLLKKEHQPA